MFDSSLNFDLFLGDFEPQSGPQMVPQIESLKNLTWASWAPLGPPQGALFVSFPRGPRAAKGRPDALEPFWSLEGSCGAWRRVAWSLEGVPWSLESSLEPGGGPMEPGGIPCIGSLFSKVFGETFWPGDPA